MGRLNKLLMGIIGDPWPSRRGGMKTRARIHDFDARTSRPGWLNLRPQAWVPTATATGSANPLSAHTGWVFAAAFLVSLALPIELSIHLGSLRLAPPRVVGLLAFIPAMFTWIRWGPSRWLAADFMILGAAGWSLISLLENDTVQKAIEFGGANILEIWCAYLIARTTITDAASFERFLRIGGIVLVCTAIVMLPEFLTGVHWTHEVATQVFGRPFDSSFAIVDERQGFMRSFGPFDHPILAGVFGSAFLLLLWRRGDTGHRSRIPGLLGAIGITIMSISSAAILSACLQVALALYRRALRQVRSRWLVLAGAVLVLLTCASFMAEGAIIPALVRRFTLDPQTSYYRMMVWELGLKEVEHAPWLGAGVNHWYQPALDDVSVDAFWLLNAMRHGLLFAFLIALATVTLMIRAGKNSAGDSASSRTAWAWLVCMLSFVLCGFTVHYWNTALALFFFMLGAGAWIGTPAVLAAANGPPAQGTWLKPAAAPFHSTMPHSGFMRRPGDRAPTGRSA